MPYTGWMPKNVKGYLRRGDISTEITDDVLNWSDLQVLLERNELSGTFTDIERALHIKDSAAAIIDSEFMTNELSGNIFFDIYVRAARDLEDYNNSFSMQLDFSTYVKHESYTEIAGHSRDFKTLVDSFGGVSFDMPVSEMNPIIWTYRHQRMISGASWTIAEDTYTIPLIPTFNEHTYRPFVNLDTVNIPTNGIENDFKTQRSGRSASDDRDWLFESGANYGYIFGGEESMFMNIDLEIFAPSWANANLTILDVVHEDTNGSRTFIKRWNIPRGRIYRIRDRVEMHVQAGAKISLIFGVQVINPITIGGSYSFRVEKFNTLNIRYGDISRLTTLIDMVAPETVMNRLLAEMGRGSRSYKGLIEWDNSRISGLPQHLNYLASGESIRGLIDAKFHTSFSDFNKWMQCWGYEYEADESNMTVTYRDRSKYFNRNVIGLSLDSSEIGELTIESDSGFAWSKVSIGYDTPQIDNDNGRFEPMGKFEYTTNHEGVSPNNDSLEHLSPYRADPIGIELLCRTRIENTKNKDEDTDIFHIAISPYQVGGEWREFRDYQISVSEEINLAPSLGMRGIQISLFNAPLNPMFMAMSNISMLAISSDIMRFASTTHNRIWTFIGAFYNPFTDINTPRSMRLFKPAIARFTAGTHRDLPKGIARNGIISVPYNGQIYRGFIRQLIKNYAEEQSTDWKIHLI